MAPASLAAIILPITLRVHSRVDMFKGEGSPTDFGLSTGGEV